MVLALVPLLAVGCQSPDVGNPCALSWNPNWQADGTLPPPAATTTTADYFESGNLACDGLVCIVSPATTGKYASSTPGQGYCSKPCVSNSDCYENKTDLVCRQMVLDPVFLEQLDPATRQRYLSDIQYSSYCAIAR